MLGKLLLKIREDRGITKNSMSSSLKKLHQVILVT